MRPVERILCPIDFSEISPRVVARAVAVASRWGASIIAQYVYTPMFMPVPELPAPADRVPESELSRVRALLTTQFELARGKSIRIDLAVDVGQPAHEILERSRVLEADLIVMGTHGSSGAEHLLLGSVAEKVLRRAHCPVMTVPPKDRIPSEHDVECILCAVDFSDASIAALDLAESLAQRARSRLVLAHVIEWPWHEPPAPDFSRLPAEQQQSLADFRRYLETQATNRLRALAEKMETTLSVSERVAHGKAYEQILCIATRENAELITIGVHGRNLADLALFGSTTNQLIRRAECPVVTLRT